MRYTSINAKDAKALGTRPPTKDENQAMPFFPLTPPLKWLPSGPCFHTLYSYWRSKSKETRPECKEMRPECKEIAFLMYLHIFTLPRKAGNAAGLGWGVIATSPSELLMWRFPSFLLAAAVAACCCSSSCEFGWVEVLHVHAPCV